MPDFLRSRRGAFTYARPKLCSQKAPPPKPTPRVQKKGNEFSNLAEGDCLVTKDNLEGTEVETIDCSASHRYEVLLSFKLPFNEYRGEEQTKAIGKKLCESTFDEYVGLPVDKSKLESLVRWPTKASWDKGDHLLICIAGDQEPYKGTLKAAKR